MKFQILIAILSIQLAAYVRALNLVCFYDSSSFLREGPGKLQNAQLEQALPYCTHLMYGYAGINPESFHVRSLNENLDVYKNQFVEITKLKHKYPHLKVLLSVGGDRDPDAKHPDSKYVKLLESSAEQKRAFITSAQSLINMYGFDGLDLAYQFPRNKPRKVHGALGNWWKISKKIFTGDEIVDEAASRHKEQFTAFVRNLKDALRTNNRLLSLTVLPNVNSTWYFDPQALDNYIDFVNLAAFDFTTPERNPEEADYTAPVYKLDGERRLPHYNVESQVNYWLNNGFPGYKLNLGIATYGRAWKLTKDSGYKGVPVVESTDGAAPAGPESLTPGLRSYPEICAMLPNEQNKLKKGNDAPLGYVKDTTGHFGAYAYRPADSNGNNGIWISFDDLVSAANKGGYIRTKGLGGAAVFDLSYDDFAGRCQSGAFERFPLLRAIKHRL